MTTNDTSNNLSKEIYNFNAACTFLDYSKSYLYKLTSQNLVPFFKPRQKMIYFSREDLDSWLLQRRQKTREEIEAEAATYVTISSPSKH